MKLLDDSTVESMLADVRQIESGLGYGREAGLCCHIKALAAEREFLLDQNRERRSRIIDLHDATIILRNGISKLPEPMRTGFMKLYGDRANELIGMRCCND